MSVPLPSPDSFNPAEYWSARLARTFDVSGVGYLGMGQAYNAWAYRVRQSVFRLRVRQAAGPAAGLRVLDVGAGTGIYVSQWQRLGATDITGLDLTPVAVQHLRTRYPRHTFLCGDIGNPSVVVPPGTYDAVSAMDVLFHIVDDQRYRTALRNLYTALRPGGWLIFSENFLHRPTVRGRHFVFRSMDEILAGVAAAGFDVVGRWPLLVLMNAPVDGRRVWWRRAWPAFQRLLCRSEALGFCWGLLAFPLEWVLVRCRRESPTTELMICRKPE